MPLRRPEGPRFIAPSLGRGPLGRRHASSNTKPYPAASFEVCFADGRVSEYFYFDDIAGRRLRPEMLTRKQALEAAKALALASGDRDSD